MNRIVLFGNAGAGKSTLAKQLVRDHRLAHLDLDTLAWLPEQPPKRRPLADSRPDILTFIEANPNWVIEGSYSDLLQVALRFATKVVFLNPGIETCLAHCRKRPWEPHKYPSQEAQDANLETLLQWVRQYESRHDEFSLSAHRDLYNAFRGEKIEITHNTGSGFPS